MSDQNSLAAFMQKHLVEKAMAGGADIKPSVAAKVGVDMTDGVPSPQGNRILDDNGQQLVKAATNMWGRGLSRGPTPDNERVEKVRGRRGQDVVKVVSAPLTSPPSSAIPTEGALGAPTSGEGRTLAAKLIKAIYDNCSGSFTPDEVKAVRWLCGRLEKAP